MNTEREFVSAWGYVYVVWGAWRDSIMPSCSLRGRHLQLLDDGSVSLAVPPLSADGRGGGDGGPPTP